MKKVYVFFANGFEEIEAFTTIDVLRRAGVEVETVSVLTEDDSYNQSFVMGAHQIGHVADNLFVDVDFDDADALILPGGEPGAESLSRHKELGQLLTQFVESGKLVAAICAAPKVLGRMGLLKDKQVTCYPGYEKEMEGATCTGGQATVDGNIITGRGPGASMEFALTIVAKLVSQAKADELRNAMCVVA